MSRTLGTLALSSLMLLAGGCSTDIHEKSVYASTPAVPQTITLKDTTKGEEIWTCEVPPGQQLTLWFRYSYNRAIELGFDEMSWGVGPIGGSTPAVINTMKVPPPTSRRLDGTVRSPEPLHVPPIAPPPSGVTTTQAVQPPKPAK